MENPYLMKEGTEGKYAEGLINYGAETGVVMVTFTEPIEEAGQYTLVIPAMTIQVEGQDNTEPLTFTYNVKEGDQPLVIETLAIVGDFLGLEGDDEPNWKPENGWQMETDDNEVWFLTKTGVELEAKTYYYKATANGKYGDYELPAEGNNEYVINEAGTYDLIFRANTTTHTLTLEAQMQAPAPTWTDLLELDGDETYTEGRIFVVEAAEGTNANILVKAGDTELTAEMVDGIAEVEITGDAFTEGQFKVAADQQIEITKVYVADDIESAWTQIWPAEEQPLVIESMAVYGTFPGMSWDADKGIAMSQDTENAAIWTLTVEPVAVEGIQYFFKAAANGNWDDYVLPAGDNADWVFGTDEYPAGSYKLTFTANTEEHTLTLVPEKIEDTVNPFENVAISPDPAEEQESLQEFTLDFSAYNDVQVFYNEDMENPYLMKEGTEDKYAEGLISIGTENGQVMVTFTEPIEEAGQYTLVIPAMTIQVEGQDNPELTFTYNVKEGEQPLVIETMAIVGDFLGLEGDDEPNWKPENGWQMVQDLDNANIWSLTVENVEIEAKKYEYKAVANGNWDDYVLPAGDNANFVFGTDEYPAGKYNLTFTVDTENHTLDLVVDKQAGPEEILVLTLEGSEDYADGKFLLIETGDDETSATITIKSGDTTLTGTMEDGVAMIEIEGDELTSGEINIYADKDLTINKVTIMDDPDAATGKVVYTTDQPVVIETLAIVGDFLGLEATEEDENPNWNPVNGWQMETDDNEVWYLTKTGVELEAKTYYYKATANGVWGVYELPAEGNNNYVINEAGIYDLIFKANTKNHTLTLEAQMQAAPVDKELLVLDGAPEYTAGKFFLIEAEDNTASANIVVKPVSDGARGNVMAKVAELKTIMEDGAAMVEIEGNDFTSGKFAIYGDKDITIAKVTLMDDPDAAEGTVIYPVSTVISNMYIVGELTGGWPTEEGDWSMAQEMTQDPDNANIWTLTVENVEIEADKTYYYKATAQLNWDGYQLPAEGNQNYYFAEGGLYTLTFKADTENHTVEIIAAEKQADPLADAKAELQALIDLVKAFNVSTLNDAIAAAEEALNATDATAESLAAAGVALKNAAKEKLTEALDLAAQFADTYNYPELKTPITMAKALVAQGKLQELAAAMPTLADQATEKVQDALTKISGYAETIDNDELTDALAAAQAAMEGTDYFAQITALQAAAAAFENASEEFVDRVAAIDTEGKEKGEELAAALQVAQDALNNGANIVTLGKAIQDLVKAYREFEEANQPEPVYTVAGGFSNQGDIDNVIFGTAWDPTIEDNDMVKGEDGIYTWTKKGVELDACTIYYKVVKNHSWDNESWGFNGGNADYVVNTAGTYDITVYFNPDEVLDNGFNLTMTVEPVVETGITKLNSDIAKGAAVYNMQGVRIDKVQKKGLYIINGKKTMVK